jgi:ribosomal protein L15E
LTLILGLPAPARRGIDFACDGVSHPGKIDRVINLGFDEKRIPGIIVFHIRVRELDTAATKGMTQNPQEKKLI